MKKTSFENEFQKSIIERPLTPEGTGADMLLGRCYSVYLPDGMLLALLAGGSSDSLGPVFYHMRGLSCHILIYTAKGSARYSNSQTTWILEQNTVFFISANSEFIIEQISPEWDFYIGYIRGNTAYTFEGILAHNNSPLITVTPLSPIPSYTDQLSCLPEITGINESLYINKLLTGVLSEVCTISSGESTGNTRVPIYIKQMRSEMDEHYSSEFSLNGFEKEYNKSKYRLCHEFTRYYGISPMQYLISVRIRIARHLLATTDISIHEIGSTVGIDDANHFISLFRRINGVTPLVYRRQTTGSPE